MLRSEGKAYNLIFSLYASELLKRLKESGRWLKVRDTSSSSRAPRFSSQLIITHSSHGIHTLFPPPQASKDGSMLVRTHAPISLTIILKKNQITVRLSQRIFLSTKTLDDFLKSFTRLF